MKPFLRRQFGELFADLNPVVKVEQWREAEARVLDFCLGSARLEKGSVVTLFGGLRDEVDLVSDVMAGLLDGGLRPALFGLHHSREAGSSLGEMDAFLVDDLAQTHRGRFGVWEPDCLRTSMVRPDELAVVLVPGLFFDPETGARLGRGGGFFDRYLARTPVSVMRVGVAMEWQLRGGISTEAHDQRMDWLVTDKRVIRCG